MGDERAWLDQSKKMHNAKCAKNQTAWRLRSHPSTISSALGMNKELAVDTIHKDYCTGGLFQGGRDRCNLSQRFNLWYKNVDETMEAVKKDPTIALELNIGFDDVLHTPVVCRCGNNHIARILAINWKDITDIESLVPANTLLGKWLRRDGTCGVKDMVPFFEMVSDQGNQFWDCVPNSQDHLGTKFEKRGQSILQSGTSIGYQSHSANASRNTDPGGRDLLPDEFIATRGKMGEVGKATDIRCIEFISAGLELADRVLNAFPQSMDVLPECISDVFDGSLVLTYLNMLITVGDRGDEEGIVHLLFDKYGKMKRHYRENAGTAIHNDVRNNGPCVALMIGAYEGFDFVYPTCNKVLKAPSGTIIVSNMKDLLHGVGGGKGIRVTLVYAQHDMCLGKFLPKTGQRKILYGAKTSSEDDKLRSMGKEVARIVGLDNLMLRFGVPQAKIDAELTRREQRKLKNERKRQEEERKAAKLVREQARLEAKAKMRAMNPKKRKR